MTNRECFDTSSVVSVEADQNQGAFKWAKGQRRAVSVAFQDTLWDTLSLHGETFVSSPGLRS